MVVKMSRLNKRCVGKNGIGNVKVPDRVGLEIKAEIITAPFDGIIRVITFTVAHRVSS
jgi:hypothetical protein